MKPSRNGSSARGLSLAARLELYSAPEPNTGCVLWHGAVSRDGYGALGFQGKVLRTHRAAWELANGRPIPPGQMVCHSCDVRICINPDHLWLGTARDNAHDAIRKGRATVFAVGDGRARGVA